LIRFKEKENAAGFDPGGMVSVTSMLRRRRADADADGDNQPRFGSAT
jgi:hypothetical protein